MATIINNVIGVILLIGLGYYLYQQFIHLRYLKGLLSAKDKHIQALNKKISETRNSAPSKKINGLVKEKITEQLKDVKLPKSVEENDEWAEEIDDTKVH